MARRLAGALLLLCAARCASTVSPSPPPSSWIKRTFFDAPFRTQVRYLLYLPAAYETAPEPWPMILFLHGDGERGEDLALVKREGLPRLLEHNRDFHFVVVAPQCRRREKWSADRLDRFLDHAVETYRVDPRRIYATGLSTGAVASLALAARRPDRIAAAVAVSPNMTPDEFPGSPGRGKLPAIWLFHNAFDERVPARVSRRLARTLEARGTEVRLTIFPQAGHDAWSDAYARPDLYAWLLEHRAGS
jgi:predicted peptidase